MNEATTARHAFTDLPSGLLTGAEPAGVRGWLLALCVMLTIVGPAISVWLMAHAYTESAPLAAKPLGVQASILASP